MEIQDRDFISFPVIRERNNSITVTSLSEDDRPIPNPVETFHQAFSHYRKLNGMQSRQCHLTIVTPENLLVLPQW